MTCRTSAEAQTKVCWVTLEAMAEPYLCWGDDCTAWVEVAFDAKEDGNDITPKGECGLFIARISGASEE